MLAHAMQGVPNTRPRLSHHDLPPSFYGMSTTSHLAQGALVRSESIQQSGRDGDIASQGVHNQFADGIDLIHIGVLQSLTLQVLVRFLR